MDASRLQHKKWKSKPTNPVQQTPDLNADPPASNGIVLAGLVNTQVSQLNGASEGSGGSLQESLKKQKRGKFSQNAQSAVVAASDSPRRAQ